MDFFYLFLPGSDVCCHKDACLGIFEFFQIDITFMLREEGMQTAGRYFHFF